jgi:hypothetical protein
VAVRRIALEMMKREIKMEAIVRKYGDGSFHEF